MDGKVRVRFSHQVLSDNEFPEQILFMRPLNTGTSRSSLPLPERSCSHVRDVSYWHKLNLQTRCLGNLQPTHPGRRSALRPQPMLPCCVSSPRSISSRGDTADVATLATITLTAECAYDYFNISLLLASIFPPGPSVLLVFTTDCQNK